MFPTDLNFSFEVGKLNISFIVIQCFLSLIMFGLYLLEGGEDPLLPAQDRSSQLGSNAFSEKFLTFDSLSFIVDVKYPTACPKDFT